MRPDQQAQLDERPPGDAYDVAQVGPAALVELAQRLQQRVVEEAVVLEQVDQLLERRLEHLGHAQPRVGRSGDHRRRAEHVEVGQPRQVGGGEHRAGRHQPVHAEDQLGAAHRGRRDVGAAGVEDHADHATEPSGHRGTWGTRRPRRTRRRGRGRRRRQLRAGDTGAEHLGRAVGEQPVEQGAGAPGLDDPHRGVDRAGAHGPGGVRPGLAGQPPARLGGAERAVAEGPQHGRRHRHRVADVPPLLVDDRVERRPLEHRLVHVGGTPVEDREVDRHRVSPGGLWSGSPGVGAGTLGRGRRTRGWDRAVEPHQLEGDLRDGVAHEVRSALPPAVATRDRPGEHAVHRGGRHQRGGLELHQRDRVDRHEHLALAALAVVDGRDAAVGGAAAQDRVDAAVGRRTLHQRGGAALQRQVADRQRRVGSAGHVAEREVDAALHREEEERDLAADLALDPGVGAVGVQVELGVHRQADDEQPELAVEEDPPGEPERREADARVEAGGGADVEADVGVAPEQGEGEARGQREAVQPAGDQREVGDAVTAHLEVRRGVEDLEDLGGRGVGDGADVEEPVVGRLEEEAGVGGDVQPRRRG